MDSELAIAWIDLSFAVQSTFKREVKVILNNISGGFSFGSINALMGSSGSGKTILLKCLNGDNENGLGKGTKIFLNSKEKIRSCFIDQDQNEGLLKGLTVRQSLIYASKLKNSNEKERVNHKNNVKDLMSELLISDIGNNSIDNCSGGEIKRLTIALELTSYSKPNILFIDESIAGLDSNAAEVVSF
jgi:ABC-type multidrug transport system ATPase subunit